MRILNEFIADARAQVEETWSLADAPAFITKYTYLRGTRYSFRDHEFQEKILSDATQIVNTQKCSQIGMSEATARWAVSVTCMLSDFSCIITFPFSGDANDFARTRVDPFIDNSPKLREMVSSKLNNSDVKMFGSSLLYFRGTNGKTQAISVPADCIVSDEIDRSDPDTLTQFHSRLTHSKWRLRRNFSTPTIPGFGIAKEMDTSMRFRNVCKCNHCNHYFIPDYFEHVKIPGFDHHLRTLTRSNIAKTRYLEAVLLCPKCGIQPSLAPAHREWVCENPDSNLEPHGYYVSPFDAPRVISVLDLIKSSCSYARYTEFVNQNLGLAEEDASESLTLKDVTRSFTVMGMELMSTNMHAMGIDMGLTCFIVISRLTLNGQWIIVHRERCSIGSLEMRKKQLQKDYRVLITVVDSLPYTDTVIRMQREDHNLFGAVYSNAKALETFKVKMFEGDEAEGKLPIHTAQINRNKCMDGLLGAFKQNEVVIQAQNDEEDDLYCRHLLDMRRVQIFDENQELNWQWTKSLAGQDHYHHASLYSWVASQLRGTLINSTALPMPIFRTFKVTHSKSLTASS